MMKSLILRNPHVARCKTALLTAIPLALSGILLSSTANAQTEPDVETRDRPLWEAGVAGIGLSSPAYPGAADRSQRGLVIPWLIYRGPVFRVDGGTAGARVVKTEKVEFDIGFAGALGASSDDVELRKGMPDLGFLFEFGPRMRLNVARPSPNSVVRLDLPLRGVFEAEGGVNHRGFAFEPRIAYENREITPGWGLSASASVAIGDRKFNEYLYGVPTLFATPTRAGYTAKPGVITPRIQLTLSHKLTKDLRFFFFARSDFSGSGANRDSPLHVSNQGTSLGLGAVWTLGRSTQTQKD